MIGALTFPVRQGRCSGINITNVALGPLSGRTTTITFDVKWPNSWRSTGAGAPAPNNWDAAGAGYYGSMELSGNLTERAVTVGNSTGRSFQGRYHRNGKLASDGSHNVSTWPAVGAGGGFLGGGWKTTPTGYVSLASRTYSHYTNHPCSDDDGGRGVRIAP